jgi:hypothetical protein
MTTAPGPLFADASSAVCVVDPPTVIGTASTGASTNSTTAPIVRS